MNSDAQAGKTVVDGNNVLFTTQTINNLMGRGEVFINGLEWMARSQQDNDTIEKDTVVRILRIDGVKLIVERKER